MHHGVQRLHTAVHHFREIRHHIDGRHINARFGNHLRGAAGRNNLSPNSSCKARANSTTPVLSVTENQNAFNLGVSHVSSSVFLPLTFCLPYQPNRPYAATSTRVGEKRPHRTAASAAKPKCTLSTQIRVVFRARGFRIILLISLIDKLGNNGDGELSGRFCTKLQTNGAFDALPPFFSAAL